MADSEPKIKEKDRSGRTCFQRFQDALSLVPPGATPPDWRVLWLIFISLFSSAFTLTFLFPFLPEMILTFGYTEEEKGTYVGLVASSVFAGRAVGSFFWGWLSDLKGRRLVLLITIFFNGFFSFLFGFANSLPFAMAVRFLAGLANGTVGVAKTVLYDVSDNTNQAFSMSVISIAWGSGLILGPTVGGFLAVPATKYPNVFPSQGFFVDFPFLLPSFCCLVVCVLVLLIVFFTFQEPKVLLNKEDIPAEDLHNTGDKAGEADRMVASSPARQDITSAVPISQPRPKRLRHDSSSSYQSGSAMVGMSIENLHCEADLSYYLARQHSHSSQEDAEAACMSRSIHSLSPAAVPLISSQEEQASATLEHSHFHKCATPRAHNLDGFNSIVGHSLPKSEAATSEIAVSMGEMDADREAAQLTSADMLQDNGKVRAPHGAGAEVAVELKAYTYAEESCERRRPTLLSCLHAISHSALIQLLRIRDVRHSVALYTVVSFAIIGYDDVFTIFASTPVDYDGLGFSTDQIGLALGVVSIPLMFLQIKLYPLLVSKFGIKRTYLINTFFIFIPVQLIPLLHMLAHNKVWLWVCLVVLALPMRVAMTSCFTGSSLFINNSVTADSAGKANGLGMTFTAIARTLGPTVGGALFSWSLKMSRTKGPPLDVNLTFVVFGLVLFFNAVHCVFLPDHLDHQKK